MIEASLAAREIAESLRTAYWMEAYGHEGVVAAKVDASRAELHHLARLMGYTLTPMSAQVAEDAA